MGTGSCSRMWTHIYFRPRWCCNWKSSLCWSNGSLKSRGSTGKQIKIIVFNFPHDLIAYWCSYFFSSIHLKSLNLQDEKHKLIYSYYVCETEFLQVDTVSFNVTCHSFIVFYAAVTCATGECGRTLGSIWHKARRASTAGDCLGMGLDQKRRNMEWPSSDDRRACVVGLRSNYRWRVFAPVGYLTKMKSHLEEQEHGVTFENYAVILAV